MQAVNCGRESIDYHWPDATWKRGIWLKRNTTCSWWVVVQAVCALHDGLQGSVPVLHSLKNDIWAERA